MKTLQEVKQILIESKLRLREDFRVTELGLCRKNGRV